MASLQIIISTNFNSINSETLFPFTPGLYDLELVAKLVNRDPLVTLSKIALNLPIGAFDFHISPDTAVYFNWSPEEKRYVVSIEKRDAAFVLKGQPRS